MDLSQMVVNFANEIVGPAWILLWALATVVGVWYVGTAILRMVRAARIPGQQVITTGDILPVLIIGALLANLSTVINTIWNSFGSGTASYAAISYAGLDEFGRFKDAINAVLTIASIAGGFFFFKGLVILKKACDGHSSQGANDVVWRAITHMIGGAFLVQIPAVIDAFRETFNLYW